MTESSVTYPMDWTWKLCFYLAAGIGLVAGGGAALELSGLVERGKIIGEAGTGELWAAVVVGVLLQPFAWTGLQHARIRLADDHLEYLRFGIVCGTESIPLSRVERFGSGFEKASSGGKERILLIDLGAEGVRSIKLAMYRGGKGLLTELESRLGQPPAEVERSLTGLRFADS